MENQPQVYTLDEVNDLIPSLSEVLPQLRDLREQIATEKDRHDVEELTSHGTVGEAAEKSKKKMDDHKRKIVSHENEFERMLRIFHDIGCVLRSLDPGLVDFYSQMNDELVFLCWKEGEEDVRYWHGLNEGYDGRQSIL